MGQKFIRVMGLMLAALAVEEIFKGLALAGFHVVS